VAANKQATEPKVPSDYVEKVLRHHDMVNRYKICVSQTVYPTLPEFSPDF